MALLMGNGLPGGITDTFFYFFVEHVLVDILWLTGVSLHILGIQF